VRHVGELDEVAEILDARVAASFVEVVYERRAIRGRKDRRIAADADAACRVACVLDELARRGALHDRAAQATWKPHAFAVEIGPRSFPDLQGLGIVTEDQTDLL